MKSSVQRLGLYGDLPARLLHWGVRRCPWFLEPVLIAGYSALIWLFCGKVRRRIVRNLKVLDPHSPALIHSFRSIAVFWNFAWVMADGARENRGGREIRWEVEGLDHFREAAKHDGGLVLMTAHMGSYDLAARFFAGRFERQVNPVRAPERNAAAQEFAEQARAGEEQDGVSTKVNRSDGMLGVELVKALSDGQAVAIQGDRVMFDVSPIKVPFGKEWQWQLPKGPFALAAASRAPIYPVFIIRSGYQQFRVEVGARIEVKLARGPERDLAIRSAAEEWGRVLEDVVRRCGTQWFVFEDRFERKGDDSV